jgi:hypothetical protein
VAGSTALIKAAETDMFILQNNPSHLQPSHEYAPCAVT